MNVETIKCQVSFSMDVWHFFWTCWVNVMTGESSGFYWHFCPIQPTVKLLVFIGIFVQVYQWWKFWSFWPRILSLAALAMNTNGESCVIWSLPLRNPWHSARPREFAVAGGNLWHPAVRTEVRTPGGKCWHGIKSTRIYAGREGVKKLLIVSTAYRLWRLIILKGR